MDDDTLDLLANYSKTKKYVEKKDIPQKIIKKPEERDDNTEILELLKDRMAMGVKKYGHGVRINQNTQDFGTIDDDWELMALEEMLDGLIYTTASIIRYRRKVKKQQESKKQENEQQESKQQESKQQEKKQLICQKQINIDKTN